MVQLVLDLFETMQSSFHASNLTENEYVTASPAQDCCVIALDWLTMLAKEIQLINHQSQRCVDVS